MKKIHLLWLLAGLLTLATGCSEEDYSELTSSQKLEIVKSDVNFSAEASQGVIEVKTDRILNATSSEEWCTTSISGNIVTVHVESLIAREGRSALITLSDGVKKAQVTVHQAGIIGDCKARNSILSLPKPTRYRYLPKSVVNMILTSVPPPG